MRISYKIVLLVSVALVLYLISSAIFFVVNQKTTEYYDFSATIKNFENGILSTIIHEKNYSLHLDSKDANAVLTGNEKSRQELTKIASRATNMGQDVRSLTNSLGTYRSTFQQLINNNQQIATLKQGLNQTFNKLLASSDQTAGRINTIIGMTLTQGGTANPVLNSVLVATKTIIASASELSLTVDRDLLLNNNEGTYLKRTKQIAAALDKESKNVTAFAGALQDTQLKSYPGRINRMIPQMLSASRTIHHLWQQNRQLAGQLNSARDHIVAKDQVMMNAVQKHLQQIKHNGEILNLIALGLIFLILIVGGVLIGRSITKPIQRVIKQLREGAEQTAQAATQVAHTSQSMAEGASEQAASLEETSSSLEEMASMTRNNAQNANGSNALMKEVNTTVERSNQSMLKLKESMEEISHSSEETQKIVKTIDEISFQTNLLALNAAVEAARAGEAGAGFAVVADEVRNLALRAAEAARNTADLIEKTVKRVKDGAALATQTYEEFSQVTGSISKSADLIGEIAHASDEQAQGVEQISRAVLEMDKVTQHTAANAEESASASQELNQQASRMQDFVKSLVALVAGANGTAAAAKSRVPAIAGLLHRGTSARTEELKALPEES